MFGLPFGPFRARSTNKKKGQKSRQARRKQTLSRIGTLAAETLESRNLLTVGITYVNDDWTFVSDPDESGDLSFGDTVSNGSLTVTYGLNAFGTVTTGPITGSVPAYDSI